MKMSVQFPKQYESIIAAAIEIIDAIIIKILFYRIYCFKQLFLALMTNNAY